MAYVKPRGPIGFALICSCQCEWAAKGRTLWSKLLSVARLFLRRSRYSRRLQAPRYPAGVHFTNIFTSSHLVPKCYVNLFCMSSLSLNFFFERKLLIKCWWIWLQFVLLTFDDAVNSLNEKFFADLFKDRLNPNGCPIKVIKCLGMYRLCHGFRLTKSDDYLWVAFDHFWSEYHFQR